MSRVPNNPIFGNGAYPRSGAGVRPGQVDTMGTVQRAPGRPGMNPFRTGAPDSSSANFGMAPGNYQRPGTSAHSFSGRNGFEFDPNVQKMSQWGAEGLPSRKQLTRQKTATPKGYKVDYVDGTPMFTKRFDSVVPTDDVLMDTGNYFSPAELNAYFRQYTHLFRNGHDIIKYFRCDGFLVNKTGLQDSLYGSGRLDIPVTQVNVMLEGDLRVKNLWGNVHNNDFVYAVFKIMPVPHYRPNFTINATNVSQVNFDPEGITTETDFTNREQKIRTLREADADMDPLGGRDKRPVNLDIVDMGRINTRAAGAAGERTKPDWRPTSAFAWQVTFASGPTRTPTLSQLEFDYLAYDHSRKGEGMSEQSAPTKMITGVGAYQTLGTVGYIMPKEVGIVSLERATQACFSHAVLQTTPGLNLDIRIYRPFAMEWAEAC